MGARKLLLLTGVVTLGATGSYAQIPDLLNAFDAGGRAMGMGGGIYTAGSDTLSNYYNPAGLGNIDTPTLGVVFRNLPESDSEVSGDFQNPRFSTKGSAGSNGLTHLGYVAPIRSRSGGSKGAFGLAYTTGGYIRDSRSGDNLQNGNLLVRTYTEVLRLKNDFFTASFGKSSESGGFSYGVGLIYATSSLQDTRRGFLVQGNTTLGDINVDLSKTGYGFGAQAGVQFTPSNSKTSVGISVRSPITLQGNAATESIYDRIPGRISAGFAARSDNVRNGRDFIVYGVQLDDYFGGQRDKTFSRKNTLAFGGGFEYNYLMSNVRYPIRFGFNAIPSGGDGFSERNAFTFGVGYRPVSGSTAVDFNVATPSSRGGHFDFALAITYRFAHK